jgi:hypothetical protein
MMSSSSIALVDVQPTATTPEALTPQAVAELVAALCSAERKECVGAAERVSAACEPSGRHGGGQNKAALGEAGAAEPLVRLLHADGGDEDGTWRAAARACYALAFKDDGGANKERLATAGAVAPLARALAEGDDPTKNVACDALTALAYRNALNKQAVAKAAAPALVALLTGGDREGKANAAGALRTLLYGAGSEGNQALFVSHGATDAAMALLMGGGARGHQSAKDVTYLLGVCRIATVCCGRRCVCSCWHPDHAHDEPAKIL